jgi:hypothetical protein
MDLIDKYLSQRKDYYPVGWYIVYDEIVDATATYCYTTYTTLTEKTAEEIKDQYEEILLRRIRMRSPRISSLTQERVEIRVDVPP